MQITDPIADYLTRIRNGIAARHKRIEVPASNLKREITRILAGCGITCPVLEDQAMFRYAFAQETTSAGQLRTIVHWLVQMQTSLFPSFVPPNHAAIKPSGVSAMVLAWLCGNEAFSKMNSSASIPFFHLFCAVTCTAHKRKSNP